MELMEKFNEEFFELTQKRHEAGAVEYGPINFLGVDLPTFIYEEMADIANYARYIYIRMRLLEEYARENGIDMSAPFTGEVREPDEVSFGSSSFVPSREVPRVLPDEK